MTMPKKGTRRIVVDDTVYKYMIKPYSSPVSNIRGGSLTIEKPDGKYISVNIEGAIKPSMIEKIIKADLKGT